MPRSLAAAVRRSVSARARGRGEAYARQGRVSIVHAGASSVSASVRGSIAYDVSLTLDEDRLVVNCTCPYFEEAFEPCKHIWAAILAADEATLFTVPPRLWLDVDDRFLDGLGDDDDDLDAGKASAVAVMPEWQTFLSRITPPPELPTASALQAGELVYVLDPTQSRSAGGLLIEVLTRDRKKSGDWAKPRPAMLSRTDIGRLPDARDRRVLEALCGATQVYAYTSPGYGNSLPMPSTFVLSPTLQRDLAPRICETGRMLLRWTSVAGDPTSTTLTPIEWDPQQAQFRLRVVGTAKKGYTIDGIVDHGERTRTFADALFLTGMLVLWRPADAEDHPRLAAFDMGGAHRWLAGLLEMGTVKVPPSGVDALMEMLASSAPARVDCPDELRVETRSGPPTPVLRVTRAATDVHGGYRGVRLEATLAFAYGQRELDAASAQPVAFEHGQRIAWRRDRDAEGLASARLHALGVRPVRDWRTGAMRLELSEALLPTVVRALLPEGWRVEADGRVYRRPGAATLGVRSGIDWLELHGGIDFEGVAADLPTLMGAARRGEAFVPLGDGSFGMLPAEWIARAGRVAAMGTPESDHVRFTTQQTALLDAWLASEPAVSYDESFARARDELARFEGVTRVDAPPTFRGELRAYQRDALGWFAFLRRFGFGGCLADEMGLGKTVMVLAALEARRLERAQEGRPPQPSLIVVPRSLVFNWLQEAARFAPELRLLDCTGSSRRAVFDRIGEHDVVIATYGTLRRDIAHLKDLAFDYAILDEAQAIKNARTSSAKTVRLLKATHRLALSGTPVENHLGELWSLFDFLNPGLLGTASIFAATGVTGRTPDDEMLALLGRGLRPFILRRTKDQVATELPERTEQTLYCDLEPAQRTLYDTLRGRYRTALLGKVARVGVGRSTIQILEALLRLRQAACHPGLIDPARAGESSAKLDILLPRLQELVEDGRKVLVFSQFTTLLALVREQLDLAGLRYEYLDGRTRNRQARVQRFQEDQDCSLFLISLKAGGLGLNLTAAEYVFLLDPWWNPAVEAQAIDRAHRIGQTRPVFACRLIARDTVEEKVLELQASKRRLADAVVRADAALLRDLRREDLELLLS